MDGGLSLFERYLREAPDDAPPDEPAGGGGEDAGGDAPPDIPDSAASDPGVGDDPPPDVGGMADDPPPDMGGDDGGFDDGGFGDDSGDDGDEGDPNDNLQLDDKVSAVLNMNLYQRFLSLLTEIENQISTINVNMDMLRTVSPDSIDSLNALKRLNENIRLYLKNSFANENYSKNLLFFNKCLNLLKLLNDIFGRNILKGVKDVE